MRLLLTGSTGFVGRNFLLQALKEKRYEKIFLPVRSVKKLKSILQEDGFTDLPPSVVAFEAEAENWNLPLEAASAEHVVHSAGVIFATHWPEYERTNVTGTRRLFENLKSPQKTVVLSSLAAAGPSGPPPGHTEQMIEMPVTWYGKSKLQMEKMLKADFSHIPYVCLRPPMIFGPRDAATLPLFKLARKRLLFKPSLVDKRLSVLAVEDLVSAIQSVLDSKNPYLLNAYFVAHSEPVTDRQILKTAAEVIGFSGLVIPIPQAILRIVSQVVTNIPTWRATVPTLSVDRAKEIWPRYWAIDSSRFSKDFHWSAKVDFSESMRRTYEWYAQTGQLVNSRKRDT